MQKNLFLLFAVIAILAACSSGPGKRYPSQVRTNFINSCAARLPAQYKSNCECMLEKIESKYSISEYEQIEKNITAGKDVSAFLAFTDSIQKICFPKK